MDFKALGEKASKTDTMERHIDPNLVLQLDADFLCYRAGVREGTIQSMFRDLLTDIDYKRRRVGASKVNACISLGDKSGREIMATVKPYQENRNPDTDIKVIVRELRTMLANYPDTDTMEVMYDLDKEADDLIVQLQHTRIKSHGIDSSVIESGDKDLWMGQGKHVDQDTGRVSMSYGYGSVSYQDVGNKEPKLKGLGRAWFWHQMVMGDTVDNIPGLERITNRMLDIYLPLKKGTRKDGHQGSGEGKAVAVLSGVTDDVLAARRVFELYADYYGSTAVERFIEQAYLLWMQRNDNVRDVLVYLDVMCGLKLTPPPHQEELFKLIEEGRSKK